MIDDKNDNIKLIFPENIKRLAHNPYGRQIYESQVKNKINLNKINTIEFPPGITRASSSFVQGFFTDLVKQIGYEGVRKFIRIKTNNNSLKKSIEENLTLGEISGSI